MTAVVARPVSALEALPAIGLDELVHDGQALEGVLAVEDAGLVDLVGLAAARVQDAEAEVAVDGRATEEHRDDDRRLEHGAHDFPPKLYGSRGPFRVVKAEPVPHMGREAVSLIPHDAACGSSQMRPRPCGRVR